MRNPETQEWPAFPSMKRGKSCGLLQCVHQACDRAVQFFVRPPQLFDLVDRMQDRGVVLASELAANLRERSGGELLDDIHGHLAGESDRARIAADFQVLLPQIEVLTYALLDEVDGDALLLGSNDVPQHLLRRRKRDRRARQRSVS